MTVIEFRTKLINLSVCLSRLALRLTSDKDDAKDLVQETFLKSLKNRDKFVNEANLKAWAYTILKNTFINNYRKSVLQNTYRDQFKEVLSLNRAIDTGYETPDSEYSVLEITQHIEQLEDKFRVPFKMHINGYKYQEIADELTVNIGTIKNRIFTARRKLRKKLIS